MRGHRLVVLGVVSWRSWGGKGTFPATAESVKLRICREQWERAQLSCVLFSFCALRNSEGGHLDWRPSRGGSEAPKLQHKKRPRNSDPPCSELRCIFRPLAPRWPLALQGRPGTELPRPPPRLPRMMSLCCSRTSPARTARRTPLPPAASRTNAGGSPRLHASRVHSRPRPVAPHYPKNIRSKSLAFCSAAPATMPRGLGRALRRTRLRTQRPSLSAMAWDACESCSRTRTDALLCSCAWVKRLRKTYACLGRPTRNSYRTDRISVPTLRGPQDALRGRSVQ